MKNYTLTLLIAAILFLFSGCSSQNQNRQAEYQTITADQAQEIITTNPHAIILDVRTESEYQSGHINNAVLLPYDKIAAQAETLLTDKDATILVYCRSGRRSEIAAKELSTLGYTAIYDFGGINNWPYEVTTN